MILTVFFLSFQVIPAYAFSRNTWDDASTIGTGALVATALGLPAVNRDWTGFYQAGGSIGVAAGISEGLKQIFPEERPDHSNNDSFPSGHTSIAFAAATTLEIRYGWQAGFPAYVVATFVGVARHQANKHHWHDIIPGALIGVGSGFLLTSRLDDQIQFVPWADSHGGGIMVGMKF